MIKITEQEIFDSRVHSRLGHFLYSLGALPSSLPYNMIQAFFVLFYTTVLGLSLELAGLILVFYGIWNAINDPILGYLMDKRKTKWGRRVPYIVFGTIPFTLGFILLWAVPWNEELAIFFHGLTMLFLFDLGFTLAMTAWMALYTEMYREERERATVVAIKDLIAFISAMLGIMLPPMVASALGWPMVGLIFGITIPITMLLSLLGSRERKEYQIDKPMPFFKAFKETLKNKAFLNITVTYTLLDYIFGLTMTVLPLYALFILGMDESLIGFAAAGVAIGIIGGIFLWRWIYAHKGPKFGLMLGIFVFTITIWPIFLVREFPVLFVITIFPGFGAAGMLMTEPAISAAIDSDELVTGKRREATFTGILTLIARLSIVFTGITLILVQIFTGFDSEAETQPPHAELGLIFLISFVPLLGGLITLLVFKFFPLNYSKFLRQQEQLEELHEMRLGKLESV